jgi:hypothetical protein
MYLIIIEKGLATVKKYSNSGEFEVLTNNGEEQFQYSAETFFDWFLETIAYSSEKLSFLVFSDDESFDFSTPETINLDSENYFDKIDFSIKTIKSLQRAIAMPPIYLFDEAFKDESYFLSKVMREKSNISNAQPLSVEDSPQND